MAMDRLRVNSRNAAGQGLAELAIVLPVILIIAIGLFDIGRAFYTLIVVTNASREGARYLTFHSDDSTHTPKFADTKNAALIEASNSYITLASSNVSVTGCDEIDTIPGCDPESNIRVTVSHLYRPVFWLHFSITLSRSTQMMVP